MSETPVKGNSSHQIVVTECEEKLLLRLRQLSKTETFQVMILSLHPMTLWVESKAERLEPKEVESNDR